MNDNQEFVSIEENIKDEIIMGGGIVPSMNLPAQQSEDQISNIVSDEKLVDVYNEVLDNIRQDRKQVDEFINNFADLVINEGDSTSASKEALVNLLKLKHDTSDKMAKIADLMTRIKLKDKDTFPRYLAANQNNTININSGNNKRQFLEALNKKKEENINEI
jgi:cellobiose-specific phosphotransferase system component IIA